MKLAILLIFLFLNTLQANDSVDVWQRFYPNHNCRWKACAKDVPAKPLEQMLIRASYYHPEKLTNRKWMMLIDFTQHSSKERGYLIETRNGKVTTFHVTHGEMSDDGNGQATSFSNIMDSHQSSLGLYLAAEEYNGQFGRSMRLDGLESTNSLARERAIVFHGAIYAKPTYVKLFGKTGNSYGCPAVSPSLVKKFIKKLKNGSLLYIHGEL